MDIHGDTTFVREIRDPLYKYVKITEIESRVIDSDIFQRLGHISQMHSAHLVYPSARYPRKVHSLGAMHLGHRVICSLLQKQFSEKFSELSHPLLQLDSPVPKDWSLKPLPIRAGYDRLARDLEHHGTKIGVEHEREIPVLIVQLVRLAALLHDLGHGPFSHLFEIASAEQREQRFDHDNKTIQLIGRMAQDDATEDGPVLSHEYAQMVSRIISGRSLPANLHFLKHIINSALDVDKMDYILRDSYFAGTPEYGTLDVDRIVDAMVVHVEDESTQLCYASEALDSLVNALNSMFFMYNNVYLHKTVRAFDFEVVQKLRPIGHFLRSFSDDRDDFLELDEPRFLQRLKHEAEHGEEVFRDDFQQAYDAIVALQMRKKKWKALVDVRIGIPARQVPNSQAYGQQMEELKGVVSEIAHAIEREIGPPVETDLEKNIRPIGLGFRDVSSFLNRDLVYDVDLGQMRRFDDYMPHYKTLTRIVMPVRIYVPYASFSLIPNEKQTRLRRLAAEKLDSFQVRKWRQSM